ncbi:ABC transporter permease [Paraburkholderia xenovorans]|uniref:ABC transporter permease n=1 Tax=Paraburkholderia xenovorans TaxID=36873 RepID=UPI0038BBDF11
MGSFPNAFSDMASSIAAWRLWTLLGWLEIRQRYARSRLGPFWLTISMGVMIGSIGVVYGTLFKQDIREYLPFLAISLIMWNYFSLTVTEGSTAYIYSAPFIRQTATPKLIFIFQVAWRNAIILGHNFLIILVLLIAFGTHSWLAMIWFIPAFVIYAANAIWIAALVGLLSARFRDLPQMISAVMQIAFYVTPIIYKPSSLTKFPLIVEMNPLTYMIDLVRGPLTGVAPNLNTWIICCTMAVLGWLLALFMTGRFIKRVAFWV